MKNLVFGLIATVMFGFVGNGQSKSSLEKVYGALTVVDLPINSLTTKSSTFEQTIPLIQTNGVVLIVLNEFGIKSVMKTSGAVLPKDFQSRFVSAASTLNNNTCETTANKSCGWFCWIKIAIDALCSVFNCNPT